MNCPLFDEAEVRELLAAAEKIGPPPADWRPGAGMAMLWARFDNAVRRPLTSVLEDEDHHYRHWEWEGNVRASGLRYVTGGGAEMEVRRLVWEWCHGPVPRGLFPRPVCGWEWCVCPDHLRIRRPFQPKQKLSQLDKRQAVIAARHAGVSESLAAEFGVSRERIYELLRTARGREDLVSLWPTEGEPRFKAQKCREV
jgi:hypothetical protein